MPATAYFDPDADPYDDDSYYSPFSFYHVSSATASDSPASEPFPPSASSSRHPSSSSLPPPTFALSADHISAPYNTNNAFPEVFDSDREDDAKQSHGLVYPNQTPFVDNMSLPQGVQLNTETWYDPEGADNYSAAQAFLSSQNMAAATTMGPPSNGLPAATAQSTNTFRDPDNNGSSNYIGPSPFASPAMTHHRGSSFGSDLSSPPALFPNLAQQQQQQQQQQPQIASHPGWMPQQQSEMNGLQGLRNMSLADRSSPYTGPIPGSGAQYPSGFPEAASSTSSLHSQLSQVSQASQHGQQPAFVAPHAFPPSQSHPDGSMAQHSGQKPHHHHHHHHHHQQQQQQSSFQQQHPQHVPQLAVNDASMDGKVANSDLTFEQVLQQITAEQSLSAPATILQHPNRSAPDIASPWQPSNLSADSSKESTGSDSFATNHSQASYQTPDSSPADAVHPIAAAPIPCAGPHSLHAGPSAIPLGQPPLRKPTREDSFDKLKKYLKLDVNMAYAGPINDSPTTSTMRKRSASDAGPSALSAFGLNLDEFAQGNDEDPSAGGKLPNSEDPNIDQSLRSKLAGLDPSQGMDGSAVVMTAHSAVPTFDSNVQQWATSSAAGSRPGSSAGGVGPMRSPGFSSTARDSGAGTPYQQRSSSSSRRSGGGGPGGNYAMGGFANGTEGLAPGATGGSAGGWSFPNSQQQQHQQQHQHQSQPMMHQLSHGPGNGMGVSGPAAARRAQNSRRLSNANGHRRAAQSEDLSGIAQDRDPSEFLRYITAPDGSLAPPGVGMPPSYNTNPRPSPLQTTNMGISRPPIYGYGHDRHQSQSSVATSGSESGYDGSVGGYEHQQGQGLSPSMFHGGVGGGSAGSGSHSPQSQMQMSYASLQRGGVSSNGPSPRNSPGFSSTGATGGSPSSAGADSPTRYSQTALPTYGALTPRRRPPSSSSSTSGLSPSLVNPPVQTVTTSATQAASASRRKNDAHFVCPVPGCGSHFTRQFNLRSHLRSHADERPFKCPAPGCDKAFARAHDAKRHHETLHLSVKKHLCEYCGRQFARLDALHRHLKPESGGCGEKAAAAAAAGKLPPGLDLAMLGAGGGAGNGGVMMSPQGSSNGSPGPAGGRPSPTSGAYHAHAQQHHLNGDPTCIMDDAHLDSGEFARQQQQQQQQPQHNYQYAQQVPQHGGGSAGNSPAAHSVVSPTGSAGGRRGGAFAGHVL